MRFAIAASGSGLDGSVAEHFGRCPNFVLIEAEDKEITKYEIVQNPYKDDHMPFEVPKFIEGLKVECLISGGIGPRAIEALDSKGIGVVLAPGMNVKQAALDFLAGKLKRSENSCHH